jgi:diguanylate cyclase (GGDEF)-like protein/PAS domain S-box-containing protein
MSEEQMLVLAVDDNADNLISLKAIITDSLDNAEVITALSGQKALQIAREKDPDVIILDILMPGMDGFEVCCRLKEDEVLRDIPVVFLTAIRSDRQSRIHALECGAEAFLSKPIDETEIIAQIKAMKKIKTLNYQKKNEAVRLAELVKKKTQQLRQEHAKTLELLDALKIENENIRKKEQELQLAKEYFEQVFNTSPEAAYVKRLGDGVLVDVNEGFENMYGFTKSEVIGKSVKELRLYKSGKEQYAVKQVVLNKGFCKDMEISVRRKDESILTGLLSARKITKNNIELMSVNIKDITERKKMEMLLEHNSIHDYLTGTYNRRYFEARLKQLNTKKYFPVSVITADINGLKVINDAFGQQEGDKLIKKTAKIVFSQSRENDILCRVGGDEFILLMPNTDGKTALKVLNGIQSSSEKENKKTKLFDISIALGFSTKQNLDQTFDDVISVAEKYMYQRKVLERKSVHNAVIASIKATLNEKNEETEEHCERLIELSKIMADKMNLSQREKDELELIASLHDLGKIGIDERILNKPGKLTEEEWYEMKKHPEIGYRIALSSPELAPIAEYILHHHERWDGKGYPQKLSGEEIPYLSRLIAVMDAYDAMTQDRPYRKRMSEAEALQEIKDNEALQFDPKIAEAFIELMKKEK